MKRFFTAAASFLVCFLCLTGPSRATGQELTVIMKSPPMHLNNAVTSSTQTIQIATQLFASPLRYDLDWNPEPYLASSWSFSEDKKSLTLHLVPDAVFHDGKPVTSEDVAFSIMAIKANHPFKTMFEPVEAVDTPDPHTAVIRLSKPHPAILLCLALGHGHHAAGGVLDEPEDHPVERGAALDEELRVLFEDDVFPGLHFHEPERPGADGGAVGGMGANVLPVAVDVLGDDGA